MPNVINVFPLSIYQDQVSVAPADRARMVDAILEMGTQRLQESHGAAWTGDLHGFDFLHNDPRFAGLFASFAGPLGRYLDLFAVDRDMVDLHFTRSWGTISRRGESTRAHTHMQSHISLVHYLQKPAGSSGITFVDNDPSNQFAPNLFNERMARFGVLKEIQQYNARRFTFEPAEDDVLVFPSKALHAIAANRNDQVRVSIAVDIVATVKNCEGLEYLLPAVENWKRVE